MHIPTILFLLIFSFYFSGTLFSKTFSHIPRNTKVQLTTASNNSKKALYSALESDPSFVHELLKLNDRQLLNKLKNDRRLALTFENKMQLGGIAGFFGGWAASNLQTDSIRRNVRRLRQSNHILQIKNLQQRDNNFKIKESHGNLLVAVAKMRAYMYSIGNEITAKTNSFKVI